VLRYRYVLNEEGFLPFPDGELFILKNQKLIPGTIWITGLSASGKSTLGEGLFQDLKKLEINNVKLLDGEAIREKLGDTYGYSTHDRDAILEKTIQMAREYNENGSIVIVSTISHKRATRQKARDIISNFMEVFLDSPLEVCIERDYKGHYQKALNGEYEHFVGVTDSYETSDSPELVINTKSLSIAECQELLLDNVTIFFAKRPIKAVIVAAGMGNRMNHIKKEKPKCMLKINGKTILDRLIDNLLNCRITDINIVVGYKKEYFNDDRYQCYVNPDYENNNILHSLFYAEEAMNSGFIFSYSDIIYDEVIISQMLESNSDIAIAVDCNWLEYYEDRVDHPISEAELVFSENRKTVTVIRKDADFENAFGEFLGVAYFSMRGAKILKDVFYDLSQYYNENPDQTFHTAKSFKKAYLTDMLQEVINRGYSVDLVQIKGNWTEIDIPRDLTVSEQFWGKEEYKIS
jgi:L-glutamine-phosphate cytidylyltransferase